MKNKKCEACGVIIRNNESTEHSNRYGNRCGGTFLDITDPLGTALRVTTKVATDPLGAVNSISRALTGFSIW